MTETPIELELKNDTLRDTTHALGEVEDWLNILAEETETEYVRVTLEPVTADQHEANEALRQLVSQRSEQ